MDGKGIMEAMERATAKFELYEMESGRARAQYWREFMAAWEEMIRLGYKRDPPRKWFVEAARVAAAATGTAEAKAFARAARRFEQYMASRDRRQRAYYWTEFMNAWEDFARAGYVFEAPAAWLRETEKVAAAATKKGESL